jgi:arginine/lysine/ornithine decarboxylase
VLLTANLGTVVEQCTYDGTIYSAEMILKRIGHLCDYILFDEAWAGFMKFHPIYAGRFAMGLQNLGPEAPGIIATQSTHKQLASFSQASQIHIKDRHITGQKRRVEHRRFNESFMQHASTSPFYPLFSIPRCRRTDDEGPLRRSAVGRHDPARHRAAQEDPCRAS